MELKLPKILPPIPTPVGLNCTVMELKHKKRKLRNDFPLCLNCTVMELKPEFYFFED